MDEPKAFAETIDAFSILPDRRAKLEHLIELGEELERDRAIETDEFLVPGCVSKAYLTGTCEDGVMRYHGWADALIVRGFVKLLIDAFDGWTPKDIVSHARSIADEFVARSGIDVSMLESRANSFASLLARIIALAEGCR